MPELPEVETVRRGLEPTMTGAQFVWVEQRRKDLRFPFPDRFVERLEGQTVIGLGRRAKFLLADLSSGEVLIMHLGMSGRFTVAADDKQAAIGAFVHDQGGVSAHDHVVFHLSNGARVTYNDPRRFGSMDIVPRDVLAHSRHFRAMGIEPLGNALDGTVLAALFKDKKTPLKAALLDQSLIAGLGNIYVCEALHRANLSPERLAGTIASVNSGHTASSDALATAIRDVLNEAVAAGGSTLRDFAQTDGSLGYFQHNFRVYGREGALCPKSGCGGTVERIVQSGRSSFFCRMCQH